jgi:hypothetical protein
MSANLDEPGWTTPVDVRVSERERERESSLTIDLSLLRTL